MSYSVGAYFDNFIRSQVSSGRFNNGSEVVREGLRLLEQREMKLAQLRQQIQEALADERRYTMDEVMQDITEHLEKLDR